MVWDLSTNPTTSETITIGAQSATSPATGADFWAYSIALKLVPVSGTGTLSISSATNSATNPVFTNPAGEPTLSLNPSYAMIANQNNDDVNVLITESGLNLCDLLLTQSLASGTFQLVADASRTSYTDFDGNEYSFNNLSSNLVLMTITVVPEPATLAAVCSGGLTLGGIFWYRRRARRKPCGVKAAV